MSYTTIQIGDAKVGIKFGYTSYKLIMTDKNKSIMFDEDGNPNDLGIAKIIYSGYQNNCINKNVEAAISFDDFSKWVDQTILTTEGSDLLRDVLKVWADSVEIQDLIKAPIEKKSQEQTDQPITEESSQQ
jgi:hypothetical protein